MDDYYNNSEYTIYTKSGCDFCKKVKNLLTLENKSFNEINCDKLLTSNILRAQFLSTIKNKTGIDWKTFPIVFNKTHFIGGYNETVKYIEREKSFTSSYHF
jgi:glutaredoxin